MQAEVGCCRQPRPLFCAPLATLRPRDQPGRIPDWEQGDAVLAPALSPTYRAAVPLAEPWSSHLYTGWAGPSWMLFQG